MNRDSVWLEVLEQAPIVGPCELCATNPATLESLVVVQHVHGGVVRLAACDRCTRAMRRVVAAVGSEGQLTQATTVRTTIPTPSSAVPRLHTRPRPRVLHADVLAELEEHLLDTGTHYVVRVCGGPRPDGMWVGWLEFVAVGERQVRRTGQETTQSSREDLVYWASGLEPAYLEGAFARAR
jgi:hypothetical protein